MSMTDGGSSDQNRSILAFLMNLFRGGPGGPSAQRNVGFPQAPGGPMTDMSVAGPWGAGQPGLDMSQAGPWGAGSAQPDPVTTGSIDVKNMQTPTSAPGFLPSPHRTPTDVAGFWTGQQPGDERQTVKPLSAKDRKHIKPSRVYNL